MNTFIADLVKLLESKVPTLKGKVQPGMVTAETGAPYVAYSEPTEEPKRTKDGIAGMRTTFELAIYHNKKMEAIKLKISIISKVDRQNIAGRRVLFQSAEGGFNEDYKLHGYILTFNIK